MELHAKLGVPGPLGRLRQKLRHYSMENLYHVARKTMACSQAFVVHGRQQRPRVRVLDLWGRTVWRCIRGYALRLGFVDGWHGYAVAWLIAFQTFLRYAKLREALADAPSAGPASARLLS